MRKEELEETSWSCHRCKTLPIGLEAVAFDEAASLSSTINNFYTFHNCAPLRASSLDAANFPLSRRNRSSSPAPQMRGGFSFPFALSTGFSNRHPPFVGNAVVVRRGEKGFSFPAAKTLRKPGSP